jgi:hypothetical protein
VSRYTADDGTILDTTKATNKWDEATRWNGNNHISIATGTQWDHQVLYRSSKGRYYIERTSQWQGSTDSADFVTNEEAARWLLANEHDLPAELADLEGEVSE